MDDLDRKILALLAKNARMPVKEIAEKGGKVCINADFFVKEGVKSETCFIKGV